MVNNLIEYLYTLNYPSAHDEPTVENLIIAADTHTRMYLLGGKYGVEGLKSTVALKFKDSFLGAVDYIYWDNGDPTQIHWQNSISVVELIYSTTPETNKILGDILVDVIWDQIRGMETMQAFD